MNAFRRVLFVIVLGFIGIFLQSSILKALLPFSPNFMLLLVIFLAFYEVTPLGAVLSFLLGLQLDLSSALLLGPWAGTFVGVFLILALLSQRIFVETAMAAVVIAFGASLLSSAEYVILAGNLRQYELSNIGTALIEAVLTAIFAPVAFNFLKRVLRTKDLSSGGLLR